MSDDRPIVPRSPLELLENVPESLQRRLKQYSGRLATEAVQVMRERLPFFGDLEASQRASVQLVVQTAVVNFAEWIRNPHSNVGYTAEAFALVPQDLTRRIALRQTVDMVRVTMEYFEDVVPMLARNDEQLTALTVAILRYSRDLAFAAAKAYADAAEARGTWDSRMEASVVDAVVRGDTGPELLSRAAALNWDTTAPATVVVGTPPPDRAELASQDIREIANRHGRAALTDVHGTSLVAIVSGHSYADGQVPARPAQSVLRRPGGDRADRAEPQRRLSQRQRGDLRHELRGRLVGSTAASGGPRIVTRTCTARRSVGDRRAAQRRGSARWPTRVPP